MTTRYRQIRDIHEQASRSGDPSLLGAIPGLLSAWNIRPRADDGHLLWTNVSNPTSLADGVTIGLRYEKRDGTLTEDLFTIDSTKPDDVVAHYKGRLQKEWKEYDTTHKQQNIKRESFTSVNTCSFYMGPRNGS